MKLIDLIFAKLGYVRTSDMKDQLNFAYSIGKRLDEHREEVESIERETSYFRSGYWRASHMATQDDYLMRLYHVVHGCWPDERQAHQPTGEYVRPRPTILGPCELPEYLAASAQTN